MYSGLNVLDLHSTMLLLYLVGMGLSTWVCEFTFHYASTLSKLAEILVLWQWIYIPLCFYFIANFWAVRWGFIQIYIPLCFYFIQYLQQDLAQGFAIYIPLCFYFICRGKNHCELWRWIYIPLCFYFINLRRLCLPKLPIHLHSTMLLLYRKTDYEEDVGVLIYIPLCFYFIISYYYQTIT